MRQNTSETQGEVLGPSLLYGPECWAVEKNQEQRLQEAEMRMLRYEWRVRTAWKDKIRDKHVGGSLGVADIRETMTKY